MRRAAKRLLAHSPLLTRAAAAAAYCIPCSTSEIIVTCWNAGQALQQSPNLFVAMHSASSCCSASSQHSAALQRWPPSFLPQFSTYARSAPADRALDAAGTSEAASEVGPSSGIVETAGLPQDEALDRLIDRLRADLSLPEPLIARLVERPRLAAWMAARPAAVLSRLELLRSPAPEGMGQDVAHAVLMSYPYLLWARAETVVARYVELSRLLPPAAAAKLDATLARHGMILVRRPQAVADGLAAAARAYGCDITSVMASHPITPILWLGEAFTGRPLQPLDTLAAALDAPPDVAVRHARQRPILRTLSAEKLQAALDGIEALLQLPFPEAAQALARRDVGLLTAEPEALARNFDAVRLALGLGVDEWRATARRCGSVLMFRPATVVAKVDAWAAALRMPREQALQLLQAHPSAWKCPASSLAERLESLRAVTAPYGVDHVELALYIPTLFTQVGKTLADKLEALHASVAASRNDAWREQLQELKDPKGLVNVMLKPLKRMRRPATAPAAAHELPLRSVLNMSDVQWRKWLWRARGGSGASPSATDVIEGDD